MWAYKSSLTPPRFSEVPISSKESERSCICVLGGLDFAFIYEFLMMVIVYCAMYVTVYPIEFRLDQAKDYKIGICIHLQH